MPIAEQDTEITLGTGRMLAIFFGFVLVCAVFFSIGFSLGRKTTMASAGPSLHASAGTPAMVVRPSAAQDGTTKTTPQPTDFSFYKSVSANSADTNLASDSQAQPAPSAASGGTTADTANAAPMAAGYFVQVAAVTRKEDADALVDALKKKQYPAFTANNSSTDKFYHVQVGPYSDLKDAEAMRARLISDGYNPIVKK